MDLQSARNIGDYGVNSFRDNGDATITDSATNLRWAQDDSEDGLNWEEALAWVDEQNAASHLDYSDWRLHNIKELQSILDYSPSPNTTSSAAIDPLFNATAIVNEAGTIRSPGDDECFRWSLCEHHHDRTNESGGGSHAYLSACEPHHDPVG